MKWAIDKRRYVITGVEPATLVTVYEGGEVVGRGYADEQGEFVCECQREEGGTSIGLTAQSPTDSRGPVHTFEEWKEPEQ